MTGRFKKIRRSARGVWEPVPDEENILGAIRALLEYNGARVFRVIERVPKCYRCGLWFKSSERGIPDLMGYFLPGSKAFKNFGGGPSFYIEVKGPGGKHRPSQIAWIESAQQDGQIAFFADSIEAMVEGFKKYKIEIKHGG